MVADLPGSATIVAVPPGSLANTGDPCRSVPICAHPGQSGPNYTIRRCSATQQAKVLLYGIICILFFPQRNIVDTKRVKSTIVALREHHGGKPQFTLSTVRDMHRDMILL